MAVEQWTVHNKVHMDAIDRICTIDAYRNLGFINIWLKNGLHVECQLSYRFNQLINPL